MRICILAAGAAGMYCGSCLRDNVLAGALLRAGHKVLLTPLYTPLRTEGAKVGASPVFFGGVNAYLQHASGFFRHTPRAFDWLLDRPKLLSWAVDIGSSTAPAKLGDFTVDILKGEEGHITKELRRLMGYLSGEARPDVVTLPNLMFIGLARVLHRELGLPVVCELTGEDIFLEALDEPHRSQARDIIRGRCDDVAAFVATSDYYAGEMARYLQLPRERIEVAASGISREFLQEVESRGLDGQPRPRRTPPVVAYFARLCPEKGLENLVEAMIQLRRKDGFGDVRLRVGGWLGKSQEKWFGSVQRRIERSELAGGAEFVGELTLQTKVDLLASADVLSVPTNYREAKGLYILEALAAGVPVVQNDHGSFPELVRATGGGLLAPVGDPAALADRLAEVLSDDALRHRLAKAGREAILANFTDDHMAARMIEVFEEVRQTHGKEWPGSQGAEDGGQKLEDGRQKAEVRR